MYDYEYRTCTECGETKHFKEFYYYFKRGKFHNKCKECDLIYNKQWKEKNKEYLKLKAKRDAEFNKQSYLLNEVFKKHIEQQELKERKKIHKLTKNE